MYPKKIDWREDVWKRKKTKIKSLRNL
jgi:hypothetical protein